MTAPDSPSSKGSVTAICIASMIALVPLTYSSGIFDYALLPKRLTFFVLLALAAGFWGFQAWRHQLRIRLGKATKALLIFSGLASLSLINATNVFVGLYELAFQLGLTGLFLMSVSATDRDDGLWIDTLVVTGGCVSILGILQFHNLAFTSIPSNGLPSATFGYRNFAAMFLVAALPASLFRYALSHTPGSAIRSATSGTLAAVFLLYTRTRGAWLGTTISTLVAIGLLFATPATRTQTWNAILRLGWLKPALALVSAIIIAVAGSLSPQFSDTGLQRFDERKSDVLTTAVSVFDASGDRGRLLMWERSLPLIWDHVLTGVGPGQWEYAYPKYDDGAMIRPNSSPKRPHNDFVWIASEHGLPALTVYLIFLAMCVHTAARSLRARGGGRPLQVFISLSILIGVCVHAQFSFPKEQPPIALLFFLFAGVLVRGLPGASIRVIPVAASLLVVSIVGAVMTSQHIQFDRAFYSAIRAEDDGRWEATKQEALAGLEIASIRPHMYVILGRAEEKLGNLDGAEAAYTSALEISPSSWHAYNGLGIVEKRRGNHEAAMSNYERALKIYPRSPSVRTNLGALYRSMGNETRAEEQFRTVLAIEPDNLGANNNLGNIHRARGHIDSAEAYYRKVLAIEPKLPQANQNLGDLLMTREMYSQAIDHYLAAVESRPGRASTYWSLGRAYEFEGLWAEAEESFRRSMVADPAFPRSYFSLGELLFGLQRWEEAIEELERFNQVWKGDPKFTQFAQKRIKASRDLIRRRDKK